MTCPRDLLVPDVGKASGVIRSNKGPTYSSNTDCYWSFSASSGAKIQLNFTRFYTESNYDHVYVYDGPSLSSPLIGRFSGSSVPAPIYSTHGGLRVRFTSDSSVEKNGFVARVSGIVFAEWCLSVLYDL